MLVQRNKQENMELNWLSYKLKIINSIIESKDRSLTPIEKLTLLCIVDKFNYAPSIGFTNDMVSYESQDSIAESVNTSRPTVNRAIRSLVSKGYIKKVRRYNGVVNHNVYVWCGKIG